MPSFSSARISALAAGVALVTITALSLAAHPALAQETAAPTATISGQIRLRGEWDARTPRTRDDAAVLARTRVGIASRLTPRLAGFVQLQDSRAWGTEADPTDGAADALDLHQAYVDVGAGRTMLRAGRQELGLGDERLVGPSTWGNTARAFDGLMGRREFTGGHLRAFWMNVAERDAVTPGALSPQENEGADADGWLLGTFATRAVRRTTLEGMLVYNRRAVTDESWTVHGRAFGSAGQPNAAARLLYDAAAAYQFGPRRRAHFFTGMLGAGFAAGARVAAQLDYLSGDGEPQDADRRAFASLYPSAHPLYGYMDYFTAFPLHTAGAGLVDAILRLQAPASRGWSIRADLHSMTLAAERGGERRLGAEADVAAARALAPGMSLEAGASVFRSGAAMSLVSPAFANDARATTSWAYLALTVGW